MTQTIADRVKDSTTTTGTGTITITNTAPTGFRTFASVMETGGNCYYCIAHQTLDEWEVGYGTLASSTTFTRSRILSSSNAGAAVNFSAGTKDVFMTVPATIVQNRGSVWATANGFQIN
jgi:hypothetical protein